MIFFDLDDTILDTTNCNLKIYEKIREEFGIDMDKDEFRKTLRTFMRMRMIRHFEFQYHETIGIDPLDFLMIEKPYFETEMQRFKDGLWDDISYVFEGVSKDEFYRKVLERQFDYNESIPGMISLLKELKKTQKLGIVTNGLSETQHKKIDTLKIRDFFDNIFVSGDYGYGKPDPKYYSFVIHTSGCDPRKSIMIGDNIQGDVLGSLAAGMKSIYFNGRKVDYNVPTANTAEELYEEIKRIL